jgi:hypothetical protein
MNPEDWITQNPDLEACFRTCAKMLGKEPPSKALRIDTAKVDNTTKEKKVEVNEDKTRLGIKVINEYLEAGNPIIVGIDRGFQSTQNNGTTDHYIVIMGKGVENGQVYYRFYDPGTSHRSLGSSPNNRLFINMDNTITGQSEYVKVSWPKTTTVYTLSEVRPYESH